MTETHIPRQALGEELVPVTILILRETKTQLVACALAERRSLSQIGRLAVEAYLAYRAEPGAVP